MLFRSEGEIKAIIGPNGAGKTTLFNMISGVCRPLRGAITLDGQGVTGMAPNRLAERGLSRTFQNLQIFQRMSVLENVMAGCHLKERGAILSDLLVEMKAELRIELAVRGAAAE